MKINHNDPKQLARFIDFSILKPEFTIEEITTLAKEGIALNSFSLCVNPAYIPLCSELVKGSDTSLTPVVDFPFGTSSTASRVA